VIEPQRTTMKNEDSMVVISSQLIDKVADERLISADIHLDVSGCQRHSEVGRVGLEFVPGPINPTPISFSTPPAILRLFSAMAVRMRSSSAFYAWSALH